VSAALRIVKDADVAPSPAVDSDSLRPQSFDDYIGQPELIETLRMSVRAAQRTGSQLDHALFTGSPGLGKTSVAQVVANELGAKLKITSAPAITHKGELATLLLSLGQGDVLFIDEIHRLDVKLQEVMYVAMEDGAIDMAMGNTVCRIPLPKFTLLGATTHKGMLSAPLLARFGIVAQLKFYAAEDLAMIVTRSAGKLGIALDDSGALEIARRSRGTPRLANRLLRRVRDFVLGTETDGALIVNGRIGEHLAAVALDKLGVDRCGLDETDRAYLAAVSKRPVGLEALATTLSEQRCTIEDVVEPYLMQIGFVSRTPRGRIATDAGKQHLTGASS